MRIFLNPFSIKFSNPNKMGTIKLQKEFIRYHLRNLLLANRRRISGRRKFFVVSVSRQVKLTPKKPDALEEIALLFVSSRNAPPHKEELCVTTSVEAGCGRCPDMQHILSGTWDQGKKTRWRLKFAMFSEILDFMVNPPVVFNFNNMA